MRGGDCAPELLSETEAATRHTTGPGPGTLCCGSGADICWTLQETAGTHTGEDALDPVELGAVDVLSQLTGALSGLLHIRHVEGGGDMSRCGGDGILCGEEPAVHARPPAAVDAGGTTVATRDHMFVVGGDGHAIPRTL